MTPAGRQEEKQRRNVRWNRMIHVGRCLTDHPEADAGQWEMLIEPHLNYLEKYPDRSPHLTTAAPVHFGRKPGWRTLTQEGGGLTIRLWCPDAENPQCEAHATVEAERRRLRAALHPVPVFAFTEEPFEFLAKHGWKPEEIERLRRAG